MYHAQILIGDENVISEFLSEDEYSEGLDTLYIRSENLGIDEVRDLKHKAIQRPLEREMRNFFVCTQTITDAAQNAFLKLLEDPPPTVRFYLVLPSIDGILPTVLSRVQVLKQKQEKKVTGELAEEFLTLSYADRLKMVEEKAKAKERQWFTALLNELEVFSLKNKDVQTVLKEILLVRSYQKINGASQKILFEHLAVSLPFIK